MSNQPNPNSTPIAPLHKTAGDAVEGSYIVVLKDDVNKSEHLGNLPQNIRGECEVTNHEWTVLNGYPGMCGCLLWLATDCYCYQEMNGFTDCTACFSFR